MNNAFRYLRRVEGPSLNRGLALLFSALKNAQLPALSFSRVLEVERHVSLEEG